MIFILNRNLKIKIDKNDYITMSFGMIERISLNSLKFFYFVAKYGSVTLAAKKLFVTQSAVSKQIYNLEEALNTALFDRKNKTLVMTKQGETLLSCCHQVFGQLDECLIQLSQPKTENKQLVLSCEPTLSMKWLIPRLSKFKSSGMILRLCYSQQAAWSILKKIILISRYAEMTLIGESIFIAKNCR